MRKLIKTSVTSLVEGVGIDYHGHQLSLDFFTGQKIRKKVGENRKIRQAFHHHNVFAHENASHLAHHLLQGAEK